MTTIAIDETMSFASALAASGRSAEIPESADVYGWLAGSWDLEVLDFESSGNVRRSRGEAHFGWVLEGRAVQDVWIMPARSERTASLGQRYNRYGTTLRVWDPSIQAWRVTWINPVTGSRDELIGRKSGQDIVQVGRHANGTPIRWIFADITPNSFRWIGEVLLEDGKTWKCEAEFRATRILNVRTRAVGECIGVLTLTQPAALLPSHK